MKTILLAIAAIILLPVSHAAAQCKASYTAAFVPNSPYPIRWQFTNTSNFGTYPTVTYNTTLLNFGDGSSTLYFFNNNGAIQQHSYATPGTYITGLRINVIDTTTGAVLCTDTSTLTIQVTGQVGINDIAGAGDGRLVISPVPAGNSMNIAWAGNSRPDNAMSLYSIIGSKVMDIPLSLNENHVTIQITHLIPGIYILRGYQGRKPFAIKIQVQ